MIMKTLMTTVLPVVQTVTSPSMSTIRDNPFTHSTLSPVPVESSPSSPTDDDVNRQVKIKDLTSTNSTDGNSDYNVSQPSDVEVTPSTSTDKSTEETIGSTLSTNPLKHSLSSPSHEDTDTPVTKRIRPSTVSSVDSTPTTGRYCDY